MCQIQEEEPRVAAEDIQCWKVVRRTGRRSLFDPIDRTPQFLMEQAGTVVEYTKGIHKTEFGRSCGYYVYLSSLSLFVPPSEQVLACQIPKGATFIRGVCDARGPSARTDTVEVLE